MIKGKKAVQTYLALGKIVLPLLLNHERTVINHVVLESGVKLLSKHTRFT